MKLKRFAKLAVAASLVAGLVSAGGVQSLAYVGVDASAQGPDESFTAEYGDIADDPYGVMGDVSEGASVTVGMGNITVVSEEDHAYGVAAEIGTDSSLAVTTGDILVTSDEYAYGVEVEDNYDSSYQGTEQGSFTLVSGNITAEGGEDATALYVGSDDGYFNSNITVNGDITAVSGSEAEGIYVYSDEPEFYGGDYDDDHAGGPVQFNITVNGDVNAAATADELGEARAAGISARIGYGGQADITVQGAVDVTADSAVDGSFIQAGGVTANGYHEGQVSVAVRDGVSVTSAGGSYGVAATAQGTGGSASVTVENGGVVTTCTMQDIEALRQMILDLFEERLLEIPEQYREEAREEMMYELEYYLSAMTMNFAVTAYASEGAYADVAVNGDVTASGGMSENDGIFTSINAPVNFSESFNTTGVIAGYGGGFYMDSDEEPADGSVTVTVDGNVTSDGDGIVAWAMPGFFRPVLQLSALRNDGSAQEDNAADTAQASDQPAIRISVNGDVAAAARGLVFSIEDFMRYIDFVEKDIADEQPTDGGSDEAGDEETEMPRADIVIDGTLSGERGSIVFTEGSGEYLDLTVWKVALDENGYAAMELIRSGEPYDPYIQPLADDETSEGIEYEYQRSQAAEDLEQRILYIIKLEQPEAGGSLAAQKADGSELETSHDYQVAHEGDKVVLAVSVEEGYHLVTAYNGEEKVEVLGQDESGNYYIEVPRGGGVYLSVVLERDEEPVPEPEPEPDPEPDVDPIIPDDTNVVVSSVTRVPTGDSTHFGMWIGIMAASAVCLGGAVVFRKKTSEMDA